MHSLIGHVDFYGYRFEGKRFDCGSKVGFVEANLAFALASEEMGDAMRQRLANYV